MPASIQVALALMIGAGWITLIIGLWVAARGRARAELEWKRQLEHLPERIRFEVQKSPVNRGRILESYVSYGLVLVGLVITLMNLRAWINADWLNFPLGVAHVVLGFSFAIGATLVMLNLGQLDPLVDLGPSPTRHLRLALATPLAVIGLTALVLVAVELRLRGGLESTLLVMILATLLGLLGLMREHTQLTRHGIRTAGLHCPWNKVDRVVWADDQRGVALRVRLWIKTQWLFLPVPEDRELQVLHALERFLPQKSTASESSIVAML